MDEVKQPQLQRAPPISPLKFPPWLKASIIGRTVLSVLFLTGSVVYLLQVKRTLPEEVVCTQEAKQCPDGSYAGRVPPNCVFAPCPTFTTTPDSPQACVQVITPAKNQQTGECREFPTPCDVPAGWTKVESCPT